MDKDIKQEPKIGIGVMIIKDEKVLLGKRKNSHGAGEYAFPGGHLEYKESFEECAKREVMEETSISIKNIRFQYLRNVLEYLPKHYVHINLLADWESGEPKVMEPGKSESWEWYDLESLPSLLFITTPFAIEAYKTKKNYFDT